MRRSGGAIAGAGVIAAMMVMGALLVGRRGDQRHTRQPGTRPRRRRRRSRACRSNLTITGDRTATIQGTKGSCAIPPFGSATYAFSGADYPSLGANGSLERRRAVGASTADAGVPAEREGRHRRRRPAEPGRRRRHHDRARTSASSCSNAPIDAAATGRREDINLADPGRPRSHASARSAPIRCTHAASRRLRDALARLHLRSQQRGEARPVRDGVAEAQLVELRRA